MSEVEKEYIDLIMQAIAGTEWHLLCKASKEYRISRFCPVSESRVSKTRFGIFPSLFRFFLQFESQFENRIAVYIAFIETPEEKS